MNSPLRATADMQDDPALPAPLILSHTEAALAEMRRDVAALDRRPTEPAPLDIAVSRMRALAGRITEARPLSTLDDAMLVSADTEIAPVSRAAIAGLRAFRAVADDDDIRPTPLVVERIEVASPQLDSKVETVPSEVIGPLPLPDKGEATDEQPVPLRRADTQFEGVTSASQPTDVDFEARPADGSQLPALLSPAERGSIIGQFEEQPTTLRSDEEALPADIRLVDLIRRQQTLLDQLNSYQGAPTPPEAVQTEPPPFPAPSVVDQLAPPPLPIGEVPEAPHALDKAAPSIAVENEAAPPPPLPASFSPRLGVPVDNTEPQLPERSPMIIERARAERSGRHGANEKYTPPNPIPAFAAGITFALAIAGTLLYLL